MSDVYDWRSLLEAGTEFGEMRRSQARRFVRGLVDQGVLAREQAQAAVEEMVEMSRQRAENLTGVIQRQVREQLRELGIATQDDLAALERRLVAKTGAAVPAKKAAKRAPAKKAPAKKATKKAPAKKATKKAPAKKSVSR